MRLNCMLTIINRWGHRLTAVHIPVPVCACMCVCVCVCVRACACYLHDFGVDLVQLGALVSLPAELLVSGVLLPERVQQLHHLRLSQQLLVHRTPCWTWGSKVRERSGRSPVGVIAQDIFLSLV